MAQFSITIALFAGTPWGSNMNDFEFYYSAKTNSFYAFDLRDRYEMAGTWPDDATGVSNDIFYEYSSQPPDGKVRSCDVSGMPVWDDIPKPTDEQIVSSNKSTSARYSSLASERIGILTDATDPEIMGDDIIPEDVALLKKWRAYRVKLSRITDFLNPSWPEMPE